jgi:hypothetical protein
MTGFSHLANLNALAQVAARHGEGAEKAARTVSVDMYSMCIQNQTASVAATTCVALRNDEASLPGSEPKREFSKPFHLCAPPATACGSSAKNDASCTPSPASPRPVG